MSLDTFVAGAYSGTYNSVATGINRTGFELQQMSKAEVLDETDAYGLSTIDWVYRGGDVFLNYTSKAYKAGSTTPFWPYAAVGVMATASNPIGRLASAIAAATVLSSTANTPAAAAPASLTANLSILAPNFDARLLFDSRLREVPIRLQLLPYTSSGTIWFSLT